jgi:hypothetical protein
MPFLRSTSVNYLRCGTRLHLYIRYQTLALFERDICCYASLYNSVLTAVHA